MSPTEQFARGHPPVSSQDVSMALRETRHEQPAPVGGARRLTPLGYAVLIGIDPLWTYRAFHDSSAHDAVTGLRRRPGRLGDRAPGDLVLVDGHAVLRRGDGGGQPAGQRRNRGPGPDRPERRAGGRRGRGGAPPPAPCAEPGFLAASQLSFAPLMSLVWWKQVNVISLVLALAGFELLSRGGEHRGALLIGLSPSMKPLAILLPFVLLAWRQTRRAGATALGYLIALNLGTQVLLAAHAHSSSALNPLLAVKNFSHKSKPAAGLLAGELLAAGEVGDRARRRFLPPDGDSRRAVLRCQQSALRRMADDPLRAEDGARDR